MDVALAFAAILMSAFALGVSLRASGARERSVAQEPPSETLIKLTVISDSRSLYSRALADLQAQLVASDRGQSWAGRLVGLLRASPQLVASEVISDADLAAFESAVVGGSRVWIVSGALEIEFAYGPGSGAFTSITQKNAARKVEYYYLAPDTPITRDRKLALLEDHPELRVALAAPSLLEAPLRYTDEYVVYERCDGKRSRGFVLYPNAENRLWIRLDREMTQQLLADAKAMWSLLTPGRQAPDE
jgi:hypothetical protein